MREFAEWLAATRFSEAMRLTDWSVPLLQSIHILMIGIVFVSILVVAMRVLGRMRADEPLAEVVGRFSPWMWGALAIMLLTGLLLATIEPVRQVTTLSFWIKMSLIVVGAAGAAVFDRAVRAARATGNEQAFAAPSAGLKALAAGTVALWLAIIFFGRAIGYDVEIWGELSPSYAGASSGSGSGD